jgi:hypothetical protein
MAGSFADSPRNGAWGDRPYSIIDWNGPASYTQLARGSANASPAQPPASGGQAIAPANFGMTAPLEGIFAVGCSVSGTYSVEAVQLTNYNLGNGNPTWTLIWTVTSTGAEAAGGTALNNEIVRLVAFGPY